MGASRDPRNDPSHREDGGERSRRQRGRMAGSRAGHDGEGAAGKWALRVTRATTPHTVMTGEAVSGAGGGGRWRDRRPAMTAKAGLANRRFA